MISLHTRKKVADFLYPSIWKRRLGYLLFDLSSFAASIVLSIWMRFDFHIPVEYGHHLHWYLAIFLSVKVAFIAAFKLYEVSWRDFSLRDLTNLVKAISLAELVLTGIVFYSDLEIFSGFPRRVLLMDWLAGLILCSGFRISKRVFFEVIAANHNNGNHLKRTIIVGAGYSGEQLLRDVYRRLPRPFLPVGLVDDDPGKRALYIHGIPVLGKIGDLPLFIREKNAQSVIVAVPSADRLFHRRVMSLSKKAGVHDIKVVSAINDVSNAIQVGVKDLREIDITDLIGRQAVKINTLDISTYVRNKRVLITGASGSIGSEIARQVCLYSPSRIGLLDINESDLVMLLTELGSSFDKPVQIFLSDISDRKRMENVFSAFKPEVVFHAAAYKHVPVMEQFPDEAVRVNIIGTYNLTVLAIHHGIKHFVLISTDKAVNPTSIMGASKRIAEYVVTAFGSERSTVFITVRFGNVIGSRGSALPIFVEQIKRGGPVTITHPDMMRYFMTIQEAVALVLQASAKGSGGDVFVLDMGEPVRVVDLARDLIVMNGLVPDKDIQIVFTGIREGEKLFEDLLTAEEGVDATEHEKIYRARLSAHYKRETIETLIERLRQMNGNATKQDFIAFFRDYLPTFSPTEATLSTGALDGSVSIPGKDAGSRPFEV